MEHNRWIHVSTMPSANESMRINTHYSSLYSQMWFNTCCMPSHCAAVKLGRPLGAGFVVDCSVCSSSPCGTWLVVARLALDEECRCSQGFGRLSWESVVDLGTGCSCRYRFHVLVRTRGEVLAQRLLPRCSRMVRCVVGRGCSARQFVEN